MSSRRTARSLPRTSGGPPETWVQGLEDVPKLFPRFLSSGACFRVFPVSIKLAAVNLFDCLLYVRSVECNTTRSFVLGL